MLCVQHLLRAHELPVFGSSSARFRRYDGCKCCWRFNYNPGIGEKHDWRLGSRTRVSISRELINCDKLASVELNGGL
jgi:hypothetical protein